MVKHLKDNKLINKNQHGFMGKRSCLTNLLEFLEYITTQIVVYTVDVIYLDFQKAFDKVPRARLICKLKAHGTSGKY